MLLLLNAIYKMLKSFALPYLQRFGLFLLLFNASLSGQTISGQFKQLKGQSLSLMGFAGGDIYPIDSLAIDDQGRFRLNYQAQDYGMAYLQGPQIKPYFLILGAEPTVLSDTLLGEELAFSVETGSANQAFERYQMTQALQEEAKAAWYRLKDLYQQAAFPLNLKESEGSSFKSSLTFIDQELAKLNAQEADFLAQLPPESYLAWFLKSRSLFSAAAQAKPQDAKDLLVLLRNFNYQDPRLYKSGFFNQAIETHLWLIENSRRSLAQVIAEMNRSIDHFLSPGLQNDVVYNALLEQLFTYFEKRSLAPCAEYLAQQLEAQQSCDCLKPAVQELLAQAQKLAVGQIAPDILFSPQARFPNQSPVSTLSELPSEQILVVFAASWCSHCMQALPILKSQYPLLQQKNIEVVLVSLDHSLQEYEQFIQNLPFVSTCDFKAWETTAAVDYQVSSTPSYFLLDAQGRILARPSSLTEVLER